MNSIEIILTNLKGSQSCRVLVDHRNKVSMVYNIKRVFDKYAICEVILFKLYVINLVTSAYIVNEIINSN